MEHWNTFAGTPVVFYASIVVLQHWFSRRQHRRVYSDCWQILIQTYSRHFNACETVGVALKCALAEMWFWYHLLFVACAWRRNEWVDGRLLWTLMLPFKKIKNQKNNWVSAEFPLQNNHKFASKWHLAMANSTNHYHLNCVLDSEILWISNTN